MSKNNHEDAPEGSTGSALDVGKREHSKDTVAINHEFDTIVSITITPPTSDVSTPTKAHTFLVHKQRICDASDFFKSAFTGRFEEGETQCMKLDDVDPLIFGLLVNFIYCQEVVYYNSQYFSPTLKIFGKLFELADRFLFYKLGDHIAKAMVGWFNRKVQAIDYFRERGWENLVGEFAEFLDFIRDRDDASVFWLRKFAVSVLVECAGSTRTPNTFYNQTIDFADAKLKDQLLRQLKERKEENQDPPQVMLDTDLENSLYR